MTLQTRYQTVSDAKASGSTYTPSALAAFVAQQLAVRAEGLWDRADCIRILDPAVGDGELAVQLVQALLRSGFSCIQVTGYDLDREALQVAEGRLKNLVTEPLALHHSDFLGFATETSESGSVRRQIFDLVIANPPYVRTQILGGRSARELALKHDLTGRVDLYQAFMVTLSDVMTPGGLAGLITSNRFMTVKAGQGVRRHLWKTYHIHHVWDLGDTKSFGAAVLPAVTLLEKKVAPGVEQRDVRMTSIYETEGAAEFQTAGSVYEALTLEGRVSIASSRTCTVGQGTVATNEDGSEVWRLTNPAIETWLEAVAHHTWKTFGEIGKIRVGIKTTADSVFIRDDWQDLECGEPELLRPLTTHHIGRRYRALPLKKSVLYTHQSREGKRCVVDLDAHPIASAYLHSHRERLAGRTYIQESNRDWFELWVPHDPSVWSEPKLVFRDITQEPQFWMDREGSVVNGDCYWMTASDEDLLWLAMAVGNSRFICDFYDKRFNNKLYGRRRRFITQYVKHFPLPNPSLRSSQEVIQLAREAYSAEDREDMSRLQDAIDGRISAAFGV